MLILLTASFKKRLLHNGFNIDNPDHIIISCGDAFDRGDESKELLEFLYNMYKQNRAILIRGNHDDLFEQMIARGYVESYDYFNGTLKTLAHLQPESMDEFLCKIRFDECKRNYDKRYDELLQNMRDYAEFQNHVFVHGWVPASVENYKNICDPDWRTERTKAWKEARWVNGMTQWKQGVRIEGKTIVCGHWHCSYGWSHIDRKYKEFPQKNHIDFEHSFQPWAKEGILAIDACTAHSGKINVIKLTEGEI